MRPFQSFVLTALLVFLLGLAVVLLSALNRISHGRKGAEPSSSEPQTPDPVPTENRGADLTITLVRDLVDSGWDAEAAKAVAELNDEFFRIQREENPGGFSRQMILLRGLGKHARLTKFLIEHPETAGLLASVDDPLPIAESMEESAEDYDLVSSCYVQHVAPDDAQALALALKSNHELICRLKGRGLIGAEVLFIFDREDESAIAYESWLREVLQARLQASEEELSSLVNFVMKNGPAIRQRLRSDPEFRMRFPSALWPKLFRAVPSPGMFEHFADEPRVWDLLMLPEGEILTRRCGLLAIDLLYGYPDVPGYPNSYAKELRPQVIQLLLQGDEMTIDGLYRYRNEPLFAKLLSRSLSSDTLRAAISKLRQAGPAYPDKLIKYARIKSNQGLAEEVGPPSHDGLIKWVPLYYTVYDVPRKIMQGRDPSAMDWFQAIVDPAFLVVDIVSAGGGRVVRETVTEGGRTVAEAALKKGAGEAWVTTLRHTGLELPARQLGEEAAAKLGEKALAKWTVTSTLTEIRNAIVSTVGKATTFDVTRPVQFMFTYSGIGRNSWKQITGMEARLFMRGDAKVFVRFTKLAGAVVGSRTAAFLERTAKDLTIGAIAESEPGQRTTVGAVGLAISAKDQLLAWRKQVSAWWLLNSSTVAAEKKPAHEGGSS